MEQTEYAVSRNISRDPDVDVWWRVATFRNVDDADAYVQENATDRFNSSLDFRVDEVPSQTLLVAALNDALAQLEGFAEGEESYSHPLWSTINGGNALLRRVV